MSGILQIKASDRGSLNWHGLREKYMNDCLKLNLGSFCHLRMNATPPHGRGRCPALRHTEIVYRSAEEIRKASFVAC